MTCKTIIAVAVAVLQSAVVSQLMLICGLCSLLEPVRETVAVTVAAAVLCLRRNQWMSQRKLGLRGPA